MLDAVTTMIERRNPQNEADWDRSLREVLQETALAGLWRTGFFRQAAFYGGTALRLFHGLDRFSEDLDFTLLIPDELWNISEKLGGLRAEIEAFGFSVEIDAKHEGKVESAFIKANTKINLIRAAASASLTGKIASNRLVRIKIETDTDPPAEIKTEIKTLLEPFPAAIRVVTRPCLFAGKLHACLCRSWKSRVKGRDWYDLLFFVANKVPVDRQHLEARLRRSGHWNGESPFTETDAKQMLGKRIESIDWKQARDDVTPFVRDSRSLELWGAELFTEAAEKIQFIL